MDPQPEPDTHAVTGVSPLIVGMVREVPSCTLAGSTFKQDNRPIPAPEPPAEGGQERSRSRSLDAQFKG